MIKAIISDLSNTILFPKDPDYHDSLNKLYRAEKDNENFEFGNYFYLNDKTLDIYKSFKNRLRFYLFTTDVIQEDPAIIYKLKEVFDEIITLEKIGESSKGDISSYEALAKYLNINPSEALVIDDNSSYISSANHVGFKTAQYSGDMDVDAVIKTELGL